MPGRAETAEGTLEDLNVESFVELVPPHEVKEAVPITEHGFETVKLSRQAVQAVLDPSLPADRLVVVTGPCSVHDKEEALEYTSWLGEMRRIYGDDLELIQRMYFEKPRTTIGWGGLVTDPHLDGSNDVNHGLRTARELLRDATDQGVPAATEWLDTDTPEYYAGLISWGAIGARTAESPLHRRVASGLSMPVGFKNGTGGNVQLAVDAVVAARHSQLVTATLPDGRRAKVKTRGNLNSHIILRGGADGPNYSEGHVQAAVQMLDEAGLPQKIMIDVSHGNSGKDHRNQQPVARDVANQVAAGSQAIMGVMIESNLKAGKQPFEPGASFERGVSITDACVDLEETEIMLGVLAEAVRERRPS